jgi:hypothetical protein
LSAFLPTLPDNFLGSTVSNIEYLDSTINIHCPLQVVVNLAWSSPVVGPSILSPPPCPYPSAVQGNIADVHVPPESCKLVVDGWKDFIFMLGLN